MSTGTGHLRIRAATLLAMVLVAAAGLFLKYGPLPSWVTNWVSSLPYEIFFMLAAFVVVPRRRAIPVIAVVVCVVTIGLEFLQLWHPAWLQAVRSTFIGSALLGTTFSWLDLSAYPIGCVLGWLLLRWIHARVPDGE